MFERLQTAIQTALSEGASYAEARIVITHLQRVVVRNGQVATVEDETSRGVGVRVLRDGSWGFSSIADTSDEASRQAARSACAIAAASALLQVRPVQLAPMPLADGSWATPVEIDPFSISIPQKVERLRDVDSLMDCHDTIRVRFGSTMCRSEEVWLLTSEGTRTEQVHTWTGAGLRAVAVGDDDAQVRSFPSSFGGQHAAGGWEVFEQIALHSEAQRTALEAAELLSAEPCPSVRADLILDTRQLALQIHESIGHAAELDRVYDHEAAFAGGTYLDESRRGTFMVGSPQVNIVADATLPGALGTFGWDDEGVAAQRTWLVREGRFVDYLSNRETAGRLGVPSSGAARSCGFHRIPLVRMVNVSLEPGTAGSLEDLIADTEHGILMETNKSWSSQLPVRM